MGQIKFYSLIDGFDPVDELGFLQAADRIKYTSGSVTTKHLELRECVCCAKFCEPETNTNCECKAC